MATAAAIASYRNTQISFYEGITDFSVAPTDADVLLNIIPSWNTVDAVANTPILTLDPGSGAATQNCIVRNVHNPELAQDAATKSYVDGIAVSGVTWKNTAVTSSTQDVQTEYPGLAAWPPTDGTTTVTDLDGVALLDGQRVLIKDQTNAAQNGIYVVSGSGTWVRSDDMPAGASASGFAVWVDQGSTQADSGWVVTSSAGSDLVGPADGSTGDSIVWSQFSSAAGVAGSTGDLQFNSGNNGHAAATSGSLNWDDTNFALTVSSDASAKDALIIGVGDLSLTEGDIFIADNGVVNVGTGNDLTLSHNATNSLITSTTGNLVIDNTNVTGSTNVVLGTDDTDTDFNIQNNSLTSMFTFDGSGNFYAQTGSNVRLVDSVNLYLGTSNDAWLGSSAGNTFFINSTGAFNFINNNTTGTTVFKLGSDTTATGFTVQNSSSASMFTVDGSGIITAETGSNVNLVDSVELRIGTGNDLVAVHDGTNSSVTNNTGVFTVDQAATGSNLVIEHSGTTTGDNMVFQLGTADTSSSFTFVGDSAGTPATLVTILSGEQEAVNASTGTLQVTGGVAATGNVAATQFLTLSDATVKNNIKSLNDPLRQLNSIEGYEYNFIEGKGPQTKQYGVLAQQLEEVGLGHMVSDGEIKAVNYIMIIPLLIEAIKELTKKIGEK